MAELLGEVVTWDMQATTIAYPTLQAALSAAGLDPDAAPEMLPRSAFGRACKDLKAERAIDKLQFDKAGLAKFQFTAKKKNGDGTIDYDYECLVTLDCKTGDVECSENPELAQQARDLLAFAMQSRNAQDITRLVQRLFSEHADLFPINPRKGVAYFVPDAHRGFTQRVGWLLTGLGGVLHRFPVPSGSTTGNASVKEAVQAGLSVLLAELNEAVATWDETTRTGTMERAAERYQLIQHKIECYSDYLGSEQDRLKDEIALAQQELIRRVKQLKPEEESVAAA